MIEKLKQEFGDLAGAQPWKGYDCLKHAVHNTSLAMYVGMRSQILYVKVSDKIGYHAYLSDGKKAYSHGLTWTTSYYPELSLRDIARLDGQDVTNLVFWQALQVSEDVQRYHVVLDNLDREIPDLSQTIRNYYQVD